MITLLFKRLTVYLCIFSFTIAISATSNSYRRLTIEDNRLCSEITKRKIELKRNEYSALIVTPTTSKDHNARWSRNLVCRFQVEASSDDGVFAVIQQINFRRNATTGECIDYVQFRSKTGQTSSQICGKKYITDDLLSDEEEEVSDLAFLDEKGKIDTFIFISREKLSWGESRDLEIVYTSYRECKSYSQRCLQDSPDYCMEGQYFGDGYVNCPFVGCVDEKSCSFVQRHRFGDVGITDCVGQNCIAGDSNTTKIVLSAVTSLVISFVVFIACIWICKKTGKVCWSVHCSNPERTGHTNPSARVIEMQNRPETEAAPQGAPAPSAPEQDKDLPPSYDTLFPSR